MDIPTIVLSAAVGGVAGSAINFFAQMLERKSRRQELLLDKSIQLATERARFVKELADDAGAKAVFHDPLVSAATYYSWMSHLLENGKLPNDPRIQAHEK